MDYLRERRSKEISLLVLVSFTAVIANLPVGMLHAVGLEPRYMAALLGIVVIIALFLYLRFFFFLLYALLANGADVNQVGHGGLTSVELAYKHGHTTVADILKTAREKAKQAAAEIDQPTTVMG